MYRSPEKKKDFICISQWSSDALSEVLELALSVKDNPAKYRDNLDGKTLAMIFEKPSLRTRVSFDVGIQQLGGFALCLSQNEISLGSRTMPPNNEVKIIRFKNRFRRYIVAAVRASAFRRPILGVK